MSCGGCSERRGLIAQAGSAAVRGAWQEAASAARAAAVSAKTDIAKASSRVARAAQMALARRGGR
jgi:hypothetical protein